MLGNEEKFWKMASLGASFLSLSLYYIHTFIQSFYIHTGEAETILQNASQFFSFDMEVLIDDGRFLSLSKKNTKSSTKKNIFFTLYSVQLHG